MQLPISDELYIGYLSRLFGNTSNCYKFFWGHYFELLGDMEYRAYEMRQQYLQVNKTF
ncbi:MAG: hypothetical protein HDR03_03610 [Lachnospiraceae bacterium]|nr:hypothetical protein [Lachnospiraceae bacterium]